MKHTGPIHHQCRSNSTIMAVKKDICFKGTKTSSSIRLEFKNLKIRGYYEIRRLDAEQKGTLRNADNKEVRD